MTTRRFLGWAIFAALLGLGGCSFGPSVIRCNMQRYNEAVDDTVSEQFLLNLVRMKYRDPSVSLAVGSITASFDADVTAPVGYIVGTNHGSSSTSSTLSGLHPTGLYNILAPQAHYADAPTISFSPLQGGDYVAGLVAPVPVSHLVTLANSGWDLDRLLRVLVYNMNGLENASHIAGQGGDHVPRFVDFVAMANTLSRLHQNGDLELAMHAGLLPGPEIAEVNIDLIKAKDNKGEPAKLDLIQAKDVIPVAEKNYILQQKDTSLSVLSTITAYDLNLSEVAWSDPMLPQAALMLRITPGQRNYLLKSADAGLMERQRQGQGNDILVATRSVLSSMLYLSKGVLVPPEHYQQGLVSVTMDDQGQSFDWSSVTEGIFRVCVQKHKPDHAFVAVKYRGYWFFIPDCDRSSKTTFDLILTLQNIQITRGLTSSPVLTVPVSAPSGGGGGRKGG